MKLSSDTVAELLQTVGEARRLRILCLLYQEQKNTVCVSDIAHRLREPIANVSHHLIVLSEKGIVERQRDGKKICYSIAKNSFTSEFKKLICSVSSL